MRNTAGPGQTRSRVSSPQRTPRKATDQARRKTGASKTGTTGTPKNGSARAGTAGGTKRAGTKTMAARRTTAARATAGTRPVGKASQHDKATFRRRRLVALTILVVLVAGIALGVRAGMSALDAADDVLPRAFSTTPVVPRDADDAPTGPPTEEELANPVDCRPSAIGLTLDLESSTLEEGATTSFPVTIANTGQVPCLVDVGSRIQLSIYSGDDLVWTSQHCSSAGDRRILLDIGDEDTASFRWAGSRSASGCPGDQPVAKAGTYRAVVALVDADGETLAETKETFTIS